MTLISARAFAGEAEGRAWLAEADLDAWLASAIAALNDALQAQRIAAADPDVREVGAAQALVARIGIAAGEQAATGRWEAARTVPPRAERRRARPGGRLEALLGGRDAALAAEELALRARVDLDRGRSREAALGLRGALDAALAELEAWTGRRDVAQRLETLRRAQPAVVGAAERAAQGGLDDAALADVTRVLALLEAALAARAAGGGD